MAIAEAIFSLDSDFSVLHQLRKSGLVVMRVRMCRMLAVLGASWLVSSPWFFQAFLLCGSCGE